MLCNHLPLGYQQHLKYDLEVIFTHVRLLVGWLVSQQDLKKFYRRISPKLRFQLSKDPINLSLILLD